MHSDKALKQAGESRACLVQHTGDLASAAGPMQAVTGA
jgi:hypothetical protein